MRGKGREDAHNGSAHRTYYPSCHSLPFIVSWRVARGVFVGEWMGRAEVEGENRSRRVPKMVVVIRGGQDKRGATYRCTDERERIARVRFFS